MTTITPTDLFDDRIVDDPHTGTRARRLRRLAGAACLPGFVVLMMIGTALDPLDDEAGIATQVGQAVGHAGHVQAMAFVEIFAPVLLVGGVLTLVGAIRHKGAALANLAGVLALISAVVYPAIGLIHLMEAAFVRAGTDASVTTSISDQFDSLAGPLPALFLLQPLMYLAMVVLAWRSGLLPKASLVLGAAFIACLVVAHDGPVGWASLLLGAAWTAWAAWALVRRGDTN